MSGPLQNAELHHGFTIRFGFFRTAFSVALGGACGKGELDLVLGALGLCFVAGPAAHHLVIVVSI